MSLGLDSQYACVRVASHSPTRWSAVCRRLHLSRGSKRMTFYLIIILKKEKINCAEPRGGKQVLVLSCYVRTPPPPRPTCPPSTGTPERRQPSHRVGGEEMLTGVPASAPRALALGPTPSSSRALSPPPSRLGRTKLRSAILFMPFQRSVSLGFLSQEGSIPAAVH